MIIFILKCLIINVFKIWPSRKQKKNKKIKIEEIAPFLTREENKKPIFGTHTKTVRLFYLITLLYLDTDTCFLWDYVNNL